MAQKSTFRCRWTRWTNFYAWLVKTADCHDVNTYLARFELPLQLMQDAPGHHAHHLRYGSRRLRGRDIFTTSSGLRRSCIARAGLRQQDAIEAVLVGREQALRAFPVSLRHSAVLRCASA